jgi:integrase
MAKWQKTNFSGVEYYQHASRKHGVKFDCYYRGRFTVRGRTRSSGFGWGSEGWTPSGVFAKLQEYRNNAKRGRAPTSWKGEQAEREAAEEQKTLAAKKNITFAEFFESVYMPIAERNKKERTIITETGHFIYWIKSVVGKLTFKQIKPFHIEKVKKDMLKAGKSPRTIQNCFATFRQVWNHARLQDLTSESSPTRKVKIPKFDNRRTRFLSRDEADRLLDELKRRSVQLFNIALIGLHTGARASEIFSLIWGNVDLDSGVLTIPDSKSSKTRFLYLTKATKAMLKSLNKDQPKSDFVFKDRNGNKIREISGAFGAAVKALGLNNEVVDRRQKVCFHSLRHSFASWHIQSGTDLYTVKKLLGHSSILLTERYSHLQPDGLQKAVKEFDEKINNKSEAVYKNNLRRLTTGTGAL